MEDESTFTLRLAFSQGSYSSLLTYPYTSPTDAQKIYHARSLLALSPPNVDQALQIVSPLNSLDAEALILLAKAIQGTDVAEEARNLIGGLKEVQGRRNEGERFVRTLAASARALNSDEEGIKEAIVWAREGENEEDEEAVSLAVTLDLLLNPPATAAATSLISSSKYQDFAADSALSQITKARLDLFTGPADSYQSAYYAFEEAGQSSASKCGRAIAQAAQGRWVEAEQALSVGDDATADQLANLVTIGVPSGKKNGDVDKLFEQLRSLQSTHPLVVDYESKDRLFDEAAAKYGAVEA